MKEKWADRKCPDCGIEIKGEKKRCPKCGLRVGRENINPETPGSYKGYVKRKL